MGTSDKFDRIIADFQAALNAFDRVPDILNLKSKYLGKDGAITEILKSLKNATHDEKRLIGPMANDIKEIISNLAADKIAAIEREEANQQLSHSKIDITFKESLMAVGQRHGGHHPTHAIQREIEDIFLSMGFDILDGPHIEDEYHNFEALNIPADHPARDMQDTFWFKSNGENEKKYLLRTHTSTIQVRGIRQKKPPFRFIAPGKVFRCERTDASHEMCFHQIEGMMVGKDVSVGNLIYFMKTLLKEIFLRQVEIRLRPGFFPFVEPGFELDIRCMICSGSGCSVCKQVGWVELLPCGMIHPNVLKSGGIDPNEWNGFAFGLGLDRLVMMRYGIDDIRHLHGSDIRFLSQFKDY